MGNQAQQGQELELWQVVSPTGNKNAHTRPARQTRPDMQKRGNISSYSNRAKAGDSIPLSVKTVNQRSIETIRTEKTRQPEMVRVGSQRQTEVIRTVRTGKTRPSGAVRTGNPGRPSGTVKKGAPQQIQTISPRVPRTSTGRGGSPGSGVQRAGARGQNMKGRKSRRRAWICRCLVMLWIIAMSAGMIYLGKSLYRNLHTEETGEVVKAFFEEIPVVSETDKKPEIREDFLTISEYNRPGTRLATVKNIFVHYTANPGTSAAQNRSYFESLGETHERAASAHFIIGYEGEIVQCIPLEEEAYAVVERNVDSISIECCFLAEDGSFTQATYDSLIEMLAWLIDKYDLEPQDILRHYDCGGKLCPIYYVEHEDAWQRLLNDVAGYTL